MKILKLSLLMSANFGSAYGFSSTHPTIFSLTTATTCDENKAFSERHSPSKIFGVSSRTMSTFKPLVSSISRATQLSFSSQNEGAAATTKDKKVDPPFAFVVGLLSSFVGAAFRKFGLVQFKALSRWTLAFFMLSGFAMRLDKDAVENMLKPMVPPPLPKGLTAYTSGALELLAAILLLIPHTAAKGAMLTTGLLISFFPAHFYMALSKKCQNETGVSGPILWYRILFQCLFIYWSSWFHLV